jgi:hypothetical protein
MDLVHGARRMIVGSRPLTGKHVVHRIITASSPTREHATRRV